MADQVARGLLGCGATAEPVPAGDDPPAYGPRRAGGGLAQGVDPVVRGDGVAPARWGGPRGLRGGLDDDPDLPPRGGILVHAITEYVRTRTLTKARARRMRAAMDNVLRRRSTYAEPASERQPGAL